MKRTTTLAFALALTTACAEHIERGPVFTTADAADLASTAAFLTTGNGVEANPFIAGATTAETLAKGGLLKLGVRAGINAAPLEERDRKNMHTFMDATGWGATASNIPLAFTASPEPILGLVVGLGYFLYNFDHEGAQ